MPYYTAILQNRSNQNIIDWDQIARWSSATFKNSMDMEAFRRFRNNYGNMTVSFKIIL